MQPFKVLASVNRGLIWFACQSVSLHVGEMQFKKSITGAPQSITLPNNNNEENVTAASPAIITSSSLSDVYTVSLG